MKEKTKKIIEKCKTAKIVVFDGGDAIFVLPDESHYEVSIHDALRIFAEMLGVEVHEV